MSKEPETYEKLFEEVLTLRKENKDLTNKIKTQVELWSALRNIECNFDWLKNYELKGYIDLKAQCYRLAEWNVILVGLLMLVVGPHIYHAVLYYMDMFK